MSLSSELTVGERLARVLLPEQIKITENLYVGPSMFTAIGVTIFLLTICLILRLTVIKNLKNIPGKIQTFLEMIVKFYDNMARESAHEYAGFIGPYIMAAGFYICISTLVELIGFRPALSDINTCLSLGIFTFLVIGFLGFKKKGLGKRLKRYLNPINVITDFAVPVSLSFRLFGSIVSGLLIMELVYAYMATSFILPAFVSVITTLFHALIQAYIFSTLTSLFVGEAIE